MKEIIAIAATDENNAIGKDNTLPWDCKSEMNHFKHTTLGHIVVMGRKTWESLNGKPLANRINVVVTSTPEKYDQGDGAFIFVKTIEQALEIESEGRKTFVIGGGEIYRQAKGYCGKAIISRFYGSLVEDPDTFLPEFSEQEGWVITGFETISLPGEPAYSISEYTNTRQVPVCHKE